VVLFLLSAWSGPQVWVPFEGADKLAHLALYSVLGGALAYGAVLDPSSPAHVLMISIGVLYGASDEWHQAFVAGRTPSWGDWAADVLGVAVAYPMVFKMLARRMRRREAKEEESTDVQP